MFKLEIVVKKNAANIQFFEITPINFEKKRQNPPVVGDGRVFIKLFIKNSVSDRFQNAKNVTFARVQVLNGLIGNAVRISGYTRSCES